MVGLAGASVTFAPCLEGARAKAIHIEDIVFEAVCETFAAFCLTARDQLAFESSKLLQTTVKAPLYVLVIQMKL